ncbi:MAG TPA: amidohydrolase family protein [Pirellulales bacterium]|nr:amidohydrolase family protein [Pirellulales bacterium]
MEVIDGYAHCGLSKYEPIERVKEVLAAAGVDRAVLVQHLGEFDNSYLAGIASADSQHFAAVCLVDHRPADCVRTLERWCSSGHFRGFRLTAEALAARPALADAAVELGLILVLFAPQGIEPVARSLTSLFERYPLVRLVVSHLGQPDPADSPAFSKSQALLRLAEHPHVHVQLSGMKMFCDWPHEPLYPLINQLLKRFGAERTYWGSNFPVVGDVSDYRHDLALLLEGKLPIAAGDVQAVAATNAKRLWFPENA